ncbi:thioesterase family protein [Pseudomonas sp. M30-35]|uniref:acyl-CoA thioesterase n=1 Tax=Pseudomonas sp. M30-35 TaxID=1981174 RepID=UPI000B3D4EFE|nr:thioesterase family protein [Pseudomonas sp. M30-35]ARU88981.1 thioesterase [Pseudomonas sp. M30-35]
MAENKHVLHTALIPVRWGDMDSYGHVNNTLYLQYLEEARVAWFKYAGITLDSSAIAPVVLQTLHTYLKPVTHPATVKIELFTGAIGRSSLVLEHRLSTIEDPATTYGEGHCKLVWVDHRCNASVPMPEHVRTQLEALD